MTRRLVTTEFTLVILMPVAIIAFFAWATWYAGVLTRGGATAVAVTAIAIILLGMPGRREP